MKSQRFGIRFLKPVMVAGRRYNPLQFLATLIGRLRFFRSRLAANLWLRNEFGSFISIVGEVFEIR